MSPLSQAQKLGDPPKPSEHKGYLNILKSKLMPKRHDQQDTKLCVSGIGDTAAPSQTGAQGRRETIPICVFLRFFDFNFLHQLL